MQATRVYVTMELPVFCKWVRACYVLFSTITGLQWRIQDSEQAGRRRKLRFWPSPLLVRSWGIDESWLVRPQAVLPLASIVCYGSQVRSWERQSEAKRFAQLLTGTGLVRCNSSSTRQEKVYVSSSSGRSTVQVFRFRCNCDSETTKMKLKQKSASGLSWKASRLLHYITRLKRHEVCTTRHVAYTVGCIQTQHGNIDQLIHSQLWNTRVTLSPSVLRLTREN